MNLSILANYAISNGNISINPDKKLINSRILIKI